MKKFTFFLLVAFICGCGGTMGNIREQTNTNVQLNTNNYTVIKAGAKGVSTGFYLLGFIPIVMPNFADAKADLYLNSNEKLEGRSIALANQTQDQSSIYLILFSIPRYTISADIIEFKNEKPANKVPSTTAVPEAGK